MYYREYGVSDPGWKARFASFIRKQKTVTSPFVSTPCWLWGGWKDKFGYGRFSFPGEGYTTTGKTKRVHKYAHIIAWEIVNGPVPAGKELDHLCYNPSCVRPSHLEPVTHDENIARRTNKGLAQVYIRPWRQNG